MGASLNIGTDAEVSTDEQALAFGDVEFAQIVRDFVFDARIADPNLFPVSGEVKVEQIAADQSRTRCRP